MNSPLVTPLNKTPQQTADASAAQQAGVGKAGIKSLNQELAIMAGRFANLLRQRFANDNSPIAVSLAFLDFRYRDLCGDKPLAHWEGTSVDRLLADSASPLHRLIRQLNLQVHEVELILIAGLAEEHEGFADIFRTLHPTAQPLPTLGLAAQILCTEKSQRLQLISTIERSTENRFGLFVTDEDSPFYTRGLRLADKLWPILQGLNTWPTQLSVSHPEAVLDGLTHWLQQSGSQQAQAQLATGQVSTLMLLADNVEMAVDRAVALCSASQRQYAVFDNVGELSRSTQQLLQLHCLVRELVPIVCVKRHHNGPNTNAAIDFSVYPTPIIVCAELGFSLVADKRPLFSLRIEALKPDDLREMWTNLLPEMSNDVDQLAARYPFEPAQAKIICDDLRYLSQNSTEAINLSKVANAVRARSTSLLSGGIQLLSPISDWSKLVLPAAQLKQLQDASQRLFLQSRVLDDWQFLKGRRGARGVRMLFAGPPGTGKTLAAEVMAKAMDVDLLQVDLSRVVSKWIGETEKNLADVFLTAESSKAVLFFDEADALFGKRTEVSDAHDRYANLETAYLLSRLERYDGLAILATNYRQNIDAAFSRRLEFIVEFEEPGYDERSKLWQCHMPAEAPLDEDVSLQELASLYPIVGGHIRNAAVSAAFFAAQENSAIKRRHFVEAIRREYEKSGKAFREISIM